MGLSCVAAGLPGAAASALRSSRALEAGIFKKMTVSLGFRV